MSSRPVVPSDPAHLLHPNRTDEEPAMTTISVPTTDRSTTTRSGLAAWPVWAVGAVAGIAATVAATVVAAIAMGIGVPMEAGPASAAAGEVIPLAAYATITLPSVLIGTLFAMALARWSKRPVPVFLVVTLVLTALTFALPHTTQYATIATRIVLDLTHVAAAAAFIPVVAWRLARVTPRD